MSEELRSLLDAGWPELSGSSRELILRYYGLLVVENERQNLTRLISPKDFFEGHLVDVRELLKSGILEFPAMDLGSGCGVPGLVAGIISGDPWILAESEGKKAEFLTNIARELKVSNVQVIAKRGEDTLKTTPVRSIVVRAVGPVGRIYSWIRDCSTWNNLVLLKGPGWTEEWAGFQRERHRNELRIIGEHHYTAGTENKQRIIVKLERVPRGTKIKAK